MTLAETREAFNAAVVELHELSDAAEELRADDEASVEDLESRETELDEKRLEVEKLERRIQRQEASARAVEKFQPLPVEVPAKTIAVAEPDMYQERDNDGRGQFFTDLYRAQINKDLAANDRIERHQRFEIEKRAVTTATFGGIIPPQYLVDMYAKASRNGRVFCDQINQKPLPDVGMSLIIPRLTAGLAAASQSSENSAATTQDPTETDLTVNVRTIAGYSPVSRQGLERAQYNDQILFEDLIARYWAQLDTQVLNGSGASGQVLGLIGTAGIASSTASTMTAGGVYPKIADLAQQISGNMGGLGYLPDKLFMHPRRWAFFAASLDSQNRPLIAPSSQAFNTMGSVQGFGDPAGISGGFGGPVGILQGFPVYVDPNIPTNLGTNTNEDRIVMVCSPLQHLWERANDPVTLSFEQQAGTSLQVQLVVYGYVAFTAGRYPASCGIVTGLTPPSF